jgi:hypothetical protein
MKVYSEEIARGALHGAAACAAPAVPKRAARRTTKMADIRMPRA